MDILQTHKLPPKGTESSPASAKKHQSSSEAGNIFASTHQKAAGERQDQKPQNGAEPAAETRKPAKSTDPARKSPANDQAAPDGGDQTADTTPHEEAKPAPKDTDAVSFATIATIPGQENVQINEKQPAQQPNTVLAGAGNGKNQDPVAFSLNPQQAKENQTTKSAGDNIPAPAPAAQKTLADATAQATVPATAQNETAQSGEPGQPGMPQNGNPMDKTALQAPATDPADTAKQHSLTQLAHQTERQKNTKSNPDVSVEHFSGPDKTIKPGAQPSLAQPQAAIAAQTAPNGTTKPKSEHPAQPVALFSDADHADAAPHPDDIDANTVKISDISDTILKHGIFRRASIITGSETGQIGQPFTLAPNNGPSTTAAQIIQAMPQHQQAQLVERGIAPQIITAMTPVEHDRRITLRLDPPELGKLEIRLDISEHGVRAVMSAERSATGDLMRRHSELLQQQLSDAGFSDVDLSFAQHQNHGETKDDTTMFGQASLGLTESLESQFPTSTPGKKTQPQSGLDLRL